MERILVAHCDAGADADRIGNWVGKLRPTMRGKELVLVGVLKGAYAFYADLARAIRIPMRVEFIVVTSYGAGKKTLGQVKLVSDLTEPIVGKDVLLVEDIGTPA